MAKALRKQIDASTTEYRYCQDWVPWAVLGLMLASIVAFAFVCLKLQGTL